MKLHAEADVEIRRPADDVFEFIADARNFPRFVSEFQSVEKVSEGPIAPGTTFRFTLKERPPLFGMLSGRQKSAATIPPTDSTLEWTECDPPRRVAWIGPPLKRGPGSLAPSGSFTVTANGDTSRVHGDWTPEVDGLPGLVKPFLQRVYRKDRREDFRRLKSVLETDGAPRA